jgi:hypothetical protein
LDLIRAADLGISSVEREEIDPELAEHVHSRIRELNSAGGGGGTEKNIFMPALPIRILHRGADRDFEFNPGQESTGTLIWIALIGQVIDSLSAGRILLADELDGSLHPALVGELVRLYQNPDTNPRGGQLVFTTHDSQLLGNAGDERTIGRDQVWFTEKDDLGRSRLYSLADLRPRKDEAVERRYLAGRYGAIPILSRGEFSAAVNRANPDGDL